jgi:hypothetical protein
MDRLKSVRLRSLTNIPLVLKLLSGQSTVMQAAGGRRQAAGGRRQAAGGSISVYITRESFQFRHVEHGKAGRIVIYHVSYCRSQEEHSYRSEEFPFSK